MHWKYLFKLYDLYFWNYNKIIKIVQGDIVILRLNNYILYCQYLSEFETLIKMNMSTLNF